MLFHSYTFLVFLLAVLLLHELSPRSWRRYVLLVASYVFYGSWNARYSLLIALATLVDYVAALAIHRASTPTWRRLFLVVSLSMNLGMLGLFKYYNFFAHSLSEYLSLKLPLHELLLPVGISFYTFQSMSYTIDVYRGQMKLARDLVDFALFVSFFPQLVAGPIVRAAYFLPQLETARMRTADDIRFAIKRFLFGLFKKVVIADNLAIVVDRIHADPSAFSSGDLWVCAYAFAFQIYYDFSAYSDMAIGLGRLFGFNLTENFRRPYCARNISDFWRRWHISLSSWLRDYLFLPISYALARRSGQGRLLGLRQEYWVYAAAALATMALGGLWHGANWTFVTWGCLQGLFLVAHRLFQRTAKRSAAHGGVLASPALAPVWVLLTFHCWAISMVLFRSSSIAVAGEILGRMLLPTSRLAITCWGALTLCGVLYAAQVSQERWDLLDGFERIPLPVRVAVLVIGFWALILLKPEATAPFIYFQF